MPPAMGVFRRFFMAREITATTRAIPRFEEKQVEIVSLKRLIVRRFVRHRLAVFGLCVITSMLSFAYIGPFLTPYSPDQVNLRERFAKPSIIMVQGSATVPHLYNVDAISGAASERPLKFGHPLGTDDLGRDTMTRAMYGGRVSLAIGFLVSLISVSMGVFFGSLSGYLGGWWDNVLMRLNDVEHTLPDLPILMVLSKIFPP